MPNIEKLKDLIKKKGYSLNEVAKAIEMDVSTLYRKLSMDGRTFTIKEATLISIFLKLSYDEVNEIFFNFKIA